MPLEAETLPKDLVISVEGAISHDGDRSRFAVDVPSVPGGVEGPDLEFVFIGSDATYFRPLADKALMPKGKEWLLVPPAQLEQFTAGFEDYIDFVSNGNFLESKSFPDDIRTGSELVRGVRTTRYDDVVNVDEMAEDLDLDEDKVEELKDLTGPEMEITSWVDEGGFLRRFDMPITVPADLGDQGDVIIVRIEFFDHGADEADVEVPPADKVVDG